MMYTNDNRIVMTLDAGGTNFVFSAIQGGKEIADPVVLPACADCLDKCLGNLVEGFKATLIPQHYSLTLFISA